VSDGAGLSSALCNTVLYNIHTVECSIPLTLVKYWNHFHVIYTRLVYEYTESYHVHQLEKKSFIWRYSLENI